MNLARGKNGQIGRQIPGQGLQARVIPSQAGEPYGNLYLSASSIEAEEANRRKKDAKIQAFKEREKIARAAARNNSRIQAQKANAQISSGQIGSKYDPLNEKLKQHFAKMKTMGQSEMVATTLYHSPDWKRGTTGMVLKPVGPADASGSGANMSVVPSGEPREPVVWHSDYRTHMIKGNPLTRDGEYGPQVTDFDRFVNGQDVNDERIGGGGSGTETLAGGTMLGRLNGNNVKAGMGFDFSWDGITGALSDVADQTSDNIVDSLPDQLAKQLQTAVTGGGKVTGTSGGTITVQRPGVTTTTNMIPGVPNWALYTGIGLMGVGVLFAFMNTVKRA